MCRAVHQLSAGSRRHAFDVAIEMMARGTFPWGMAPIDMKAFSISCSPSCAHPQKIK
jgi:hypothetical protein